MIIRAAQVYRYELPLRRPVPLPGGAITERRGLLLRLEGPEGVAGWGEAAPLPGFSKERLEDAAAALTHAARALRGTNLPIPTGLLNECPLPPSVSFAVESACLNLAAARQGVPMYQMITDTPPTRILLNALLHGSREAVLEKAGTLAGLGYRAAKLKTGGADWRAAAAWVGEARAALGDAMTLRLDANRAWDLPDAVAFAKAVAGCNIEYIEEPLRDPRLLPDFHGDTGMDYALDETLQELGDAAFAADNAPGDTLDASRVLYRVIRGARACVWKPTLFHFPNISACIARGGLLGRPIVISAAYESGLGIATLAQYAAAFSGPDTPVGLDTYAWLAQDLLQAPLPLPHPEASTALLAEYARAVKTETLACVLA